jgi:RepB DNA-primase from phage plasmid
MPDRNEVERFLTALDPNTKEFTFQTFDDNAERKAKRKANGQKKDPFAKVFNGTLAQHWDALIKLNKKGAGIFVTVNITDLQGRTNENMTGMRSVFTDLDAAPLEPVLADDALKPHIVTETSPARWHAYWRIDRNPLNGLHDLADMERVIGQFSGMQKAIAARYGGDPSVWDLPRVLRLPGFIHRKGAPFLSRIVAINDIEPYKWSTLLETFPPVVEEKEKPRRSKQHLPPHDSDDLPKRWDYLKSYALDHLDLWVPRLFPAAVKSKQGWRVSSAALGRNLEEDISFTPNGIKDFGVHDMGDANQGRRTAIDIVEEWNYCNFEAAVRWLCQAFGFDPREYLPGKRDTDKSKTNCQAPISDEQGHVGETTAPRGR